MSPGLSVWLANKLIGTDDPPEALTTNDRRPHGSSPPIPSVTRLPALRALLDESVHRSSGGPPTYNNVPASLRHPPPGSSTGSW